MIQIIQFFDQMGENEQVKGFFVANKIDENFHLLDIYINLEVNVKFNGNLKLFRKRGFSLFWFRIQFEIRLLYG